MADYQEGHILTNPETGDRVQLQDGKWTSIGPTVGEDIKRATIPGLIRGGVNMATAPRAVLDLAKRGIAKGTEALGFPDAAERMRADINAPGWKVPGTEIELKPNALGFMVDPNSAMTQAEKMWGGPLYQPQTTSGKFYNAAIETVPSMGGGGGLLNTAKNAVKTVSSSLGGEAAGQMAEGSSWEPVWRMAGALAGGQVPSTGRRLITPAPGDPAHIARAQNVESQGVKLGAGQYTGSPKLNAIEHFWRERAGGPTTSSAQSNAVSQALMRSTGGTGLPLMPSVVAQQRALEAERAALAHRTQMPVDPQLHGDLQNIDREFRMATARPVTGTLGASPLDPMVTNITGGVTSGGHPVTGRLGTRYLELRDELSNATRGAPTAERSAYNSMRDAIDRAMGRREPEFGRIHDQMENANALRRTMSGTSPEVAQGIADPARFAASHRDVNNPASVFARDATAVLSPPSTASQLGHGIHAGAASTIAGGLTGAALAKYAPQWGIHDPSIFGLLVGPAVAHTVGVYNPVTSKVMMSSPMQSWLRNQMMLPSYEGVDNRLGRAGRVTGSNTDFWNAIDKLDQ